MAEDTLFTGQPVMSQLLSLIPKSLVAELAFEHGADRYCKNFFAYDHLVALLFNSYVQCDSLRALISGMQVNQHRLLHWGLLHTPRRSTLADANTRRPAEFFEALFHRLYRLHMGGLPDSLPRNKRMLDRLFIMDSTTVSLFTDAMHGAGGYGKDGRKKGGAKAHVLMRAQEDVPCFVHITEAKRNDKMFFTLLKLPPGSIIVFDKGYNSYAQFRTWTQQQVSYITRLNENATIRVEEERELSVNQVNLGVLADQMVELSRLSNSRTTRLTARVVRFFDAEKKREFTFLTNDMVHAPATIAALYKRRWQIELLFKRIKQNNPLRYFLGDSPNAIKTQIWCALIADLLVKVVKERVERTSNRRWAFSNISAIIRQHLGTYVNLLQFLREPDKALLNYRPPDIPDPQLKLSL